MKRLLLGALIFTATLTFAKDWGHLVTGTTDTLNKGQSTIGTHLVAHGLSNDVTVGFVPVTYLGYQMYGVGTRSRLVTGKSYNLAADLFYFDSIDKNGPSAFEQTSWSLKLNNNIRLSESVRLHLTAGAQYFLNDESPFSLRPDPQGRFITFASKDRKEYQAKKEDFKRNPRDPRTLSLTAMPSFKVARHTAINLEYGILGYNYDYPLQHAGASVNFEMNRSDLSLGASKTWRKTPYLGIENLYHLEVKYQFYL